MKFEVYPLRNVVLVLGTLSVTVARNDTVTQVVECGHLMHDWVCEYLGKYASNSVLGVKLPGSEYTLIDKSIFVRVFRGEI